MGESRGGGPAAESNKTTGQQNADRKSEATNDETLSEIEESEKESSSSDTNADPGPSPDGTLDERDELKDTDPM